MITWNRCEDIIPDTVGGYLVVWNNFGDQSIIQVLNKPVVD